MITKEYLFQYLSDVIIHYYGEWDRAHVEMDALGMLHIEGRIKGLERLYEDIENGFPSYREED